MVGGILTHREILLSKKRINPGWVPKFQGTFNDSKSLVSESLEMKTSMQCNTSSHATFQ